MSPWLFALLPAVITIAAIAAVRRLPAARRLADRPNERSLHSEPRLRVGGIGVMAGALPFVACASPHELGVVAACALGLAIVSFADDVRSLPIWVRLPAHVLAAAFAVASLPDSAMTPWGLALAVFAIAWMTNLYNFMDGSDGLAGAMGAVGFAFLAWSAQASGHPALALASLALASASAGFLVFNVPPARVFLGDSGAVPLGFLAGAIGFIGYVANAWPWWYPVAVFSPFVVDATATILRRLVKGERIWKAHRSHYYQRLVLAGWSKRRLLACECALMIAAGAGATVAFRYGREGAWAIMAALLAVYAAIAYAIERRERLASR